MISFFIALAVLIGGYFVYGAVVEKCFGVDATRPTPAVANADGIDYISMPTWRVFLIQFLNIAGLGPIFGAIMGIMYGPAAFLWISLGTIFGGGVHDFMIGMMSIRHDGKSYPEIVGEELGSGIRYFIRLFSILLLLLVGAVFIVNPAAILSHMMPSIGLQSWIIAIFAYYVLATLLPIDKLIGNLYPIFGFALIFMALGLLAVLMVHLCDIPELAGNMYNHCPNPDETPLFPMMFVSIACGAVSGFHATQSPLMSRCLKNERHGRRVFYGAMVAEGIVALIWAAATIAFFKGSFSDLSGALAEAKSAAPIVKDISIEWLGQVGGILAILGVVAAPVTSGDTALRSARLIAADIMNSDQKKIVNRLLISLPLFVVAYLIMQMDYTVLWRYFSWCNQTLAVFTLWAATVYLARNHKQYVIALIPALFMTMVCSLYIFVAPEGFTFDNVLTNMLASRYGIADSVALNYNFGVIVSTFITLTILAVFLKYLRKTAQR